MSTGRRATLDPERSSVGCHCHNCGATDNGGGPAPLAATRQIVYFDAATSPIYDKSDECPPLYGSVRQTPPPQLLHNGHADQNNNNRKPTAKSSKDIMDNKMRRSQSANVGLGQGTPSGPQGAVTVVLHRHAGETLGIGIAGGADKSYPPVVSCIRAGSIAHRCDQIMVGDRLIAVNRIRVEQLKHHDIYTLLRNAGDTVRLDFEYSLHDVLFERSSRSRAKVVDIVLEKEGDGFGFTMRGGAYGPDATKSRPLTVTAIRQGGPADRDGRLRVGDRILNLDGVDVYSATLSSAHTLLTAAADACTLTVEYDCSYIEAVESATGALLLEIDKPSGLDLGVELKMCPNSRQQQSVYIQSIQPASIADRCGALHFGDELLAVEGVSLEYTTLPEVKQLMRGQPNSNQIKLEVIPFAVGENQRRVEKKQQKRDAKTAKKQQLHGTSRSPSHERNNNNNNDNGNNNNNNNHSSRAAEQQTSSSSHSNNNQNSKPPALTNGYGPKGKPPNAPPSSSSQSFRQRRPDADKHKQNKHDSSAVSTPSHVQRMQRVLEDQLQQRQGQGQQGTPTGRAASSDRAASQQSSTRLSHSTYDNQSQQQLNGIYHPPGHHASVPALHDGAAGQALQAQSARDPPTEHQHQQRSRSQDPQRGGSAREPSTHQGSVTASVSGTPCGQVCHSEIMEVVLHGYNKGGFGLVLHRQAASEAEPNAQPPLFISYIEKGSPADKCGVLQVGDRVLAVNDWCCGNGTVDEAAQRIRHSPSPLTLTVEFDVIETVLPSSGVFTVKLAKRHQNLGIVITGNQMAEKGEPVILSDIRTGSVAHRCGSLAPGDRLLAIDNIPLDTCTVEEAVRLLHRASDIVKLRVRKAGPNEDDMNSASNTVVYSVELSRRGGPLGITIASTDEPGDPILISQLAVGGLAERTGALHAGDRLLAINGHDINGKRVTEAMQLLASCQDKVTLKIARQLRASAAGGDNQQHGGGSKRSSSCSAKRQSVNSYLDVASSSGHSGDHSDGHGRQCKLGTPVQSIDSAVESLEDSPVADAQQQQHKHEQYAEQLSVQVRGGGQREATQTSISHAGGSSGHHHNTKPSTSTAHHSTTPSTSYSNEPHSTDLGCGDSGLGSSENGASSSGSDPFCQCACQQQCQQKEEWVRILEALETVGESEMLRRLEESIMGGNVPACDHGPRCRPAGSTYETSTAVTPAVVMSRPSGSSGNKPSTSMSASGLHPPPFPVTNTILRHPYQNQDAARGSSVSLTDSDKSSCSAEHKYASVIPSSQRSRQPAPVPPPKPPHPSTASHSSGGHTPPPPSMPALQLKSYTDLLSRHTQELQHDSSSSSCNTSHSTTQHPHHHNQQVSFASSSDTLTAGNDTSQSSSTPTPSTVINTLEQPDVSSSECQLIHATLHKDADYNDFGFSVSDGVMEKGVYINKIRPAGPAAVCGKLRPLDRIVSVNGTNVEQLDCILAVPLLLSASDKIELIVRRSRLLTNGAQSIIHTLRQDTHVTTIAEEEEDAYSDTSATQSILLLKDSAV